MVRKILLLALTCSLTCTLDVQAQKKKKKQEQPVTQEVKNPNLPLVLQHLKHLKRPKTL